MKTWWVVWISNKDNKFKCCKGHSESSANKTARVLVEKYAMKQQGTGLAVNTFTLSKILFDNLPLYRDPNEPNPLYCTDKAWVLEAASRKQAIHNARKLWRTEQLKTTNAGQKLS